MRLSYENFIESRFTAEGKVKINRNTILYKAISVYNLIIGDSGKPNGEIALC